MAEGELKDKRPDRPETKEKKMKKKAKDLELSEQEILDAKALLRE